MSRAEELLNSLDDGVMPVSSIDEGFIVVNEDRSISVPDSLRRLGVQYDHNIETVTFVCPRFWDGCDMSEMTIYINYLRQDGVKGQYLTTNLNVSADTMTFDWIISDNVTRVKGTLSFLICIVKTNEDGMEVRHWNSELNRECYVSEGMECQESVILAYPDIITHLLIRMEEVESVANEEVLREFTNEWLNENHSRLLAEIEGKAQDALDSIPPDYTEVYTLAHDSVRTRANAIISTATGEVISIADSSDDYLRNLKIFGKTTQITTTGTQLADFTNGSANTGASANFSNDILTVNGDGSATYQNYGVDITNVYIANPGKILSFSYESIKTNSKMDGRLVQLNIKYLDNTWKYIGLVDKDLNLTPYTIPDDTSNVYSVSLCVYTTNTATAMANKVFITKPMLQFDTDVKEYETYSGGYVSPSPDWSQPLKSVSEGSNICVYGMNLLTFPYESAAKALHGVDYTLGEDGSLVTSGVTTQGTNFFFVNGLKLPKGRYKLWRLGDQSGGGLLAYNGYSVLAEVHHNNSFKEFEITSDDEKLNVYLNVPYADRVMSGTIRPMITPAVVDDAVYETYKGKQSIPVSITLPGISVSQNGNYTDSNGQQWVCDEIDFARGVYVQRTMEKVFDGVDGEVITLYSERNSVYGFAFKLTEDMLTISHAARCSHFKNIETGISSTDTECFLCGAGSKTIYVMIDKDRIGEYSVDAFKAWLYNNPITILFQLATPVERPLTVAETEAFKWIHTNYPNTVILNDYGALMEVTYNADTQTYLDNLPKATDAQVQAAVNAWLIANFESAEGVGF